ncbi:MAG: hypothetical protein OHK0023_16160 [Anaerolineae bacterium]
MSIPLLLLILGIVGGVGVLFWWLIFATEGVYLGRRVVIWLYDIYARRYDNIKNFEPLWESEMLSQPIISALENIRNPHVLDVATGTARLPLLLHADSMFRGRVVGLDASREMIKVGCEKFAQRTPHNRGQFCLLQADALHLPFPDASFHVVSCLEALEFLPDQMRALHEIVRVTRPGGLILLTNRKGRAARLMPGRTQPSEKRLEELRTQFGLIEVSAEVWQIEYDLIWAIKPYNL